MNFIEFYHSGLYVQVARHMVDPQKLLKRKLYHLVDESNIGKSCLTICCQYGHLDLLKKLISRFKPNNDLWKIAASFGHLHILKYLDEIKYPNEDPLLVLHYAARYGRVEVFKFLYLKSVDFTDKSNIKRLLIEGNSHICRCILDICIINNYSVIDYVDILLRYYGKTRQHTINILIDEFSKYLNINEIFRHAYGRGLVLIIKHLITRGYIADNYQVLLINAISKACECGDMDMIKYLFEEQHIKLKSEVAIEMITVACNSRHNEIALYLYNQRTLAQN